MRATKMHSNRSVFMRECWNLVRRTPPPQRRESLAAKRKLTLLVLSCLEIVGFSRKAANLGLLLIRSLMASSSPSTLSRALICEYQKPSSPSG